ncbi:hypothetical protein HCN44_004438 [Aphidius gifuensis]|uniref:Mitochondrial fission process protein 1 n=1 Tax=Aphidius gifuensis TaxID=684658 RepID=A0A834Y1R3_APHGI|nr:mitochondrial fission process protein 1 [Aphidius gifuensis]KAF7994966.1 hypothetical protein HCN44_004438 [Aphidius gifuensis]
MQDKNYQGDIFRDGPLRYLGYTNEVGEAFRSLIPKSLVWTSYVIASGYVISDTIHKGQKEYQKQKNDNENKISNVLLSTADTLLWQSFASVIVPGITINRICATVQYLQKYSKKTAMKSRWLSTAIGLISIPLIIRPIDRGADQAMNATFRKWTGYQPHKNHHD